MIDRKNGIQNGLYTEDFSCVDTIIPFRNHILHIIYVHNFMWRMWLRNGIIVPMELKSSVTENLTVKYSPRKLKLHIFKTELEDLSTYSPVLIMLTSKQGSSFS